MAIDSPLFQSSYVLAILSNFVSFANMYYATFAVLKKQLNTPKLIQFKQPPFKINFSFAWFSWSVMVTLAQIFWPWLGLFKHLPSAGGWLDDWSRMASLKQLSSLPQDLDLPPGRLVFVLMAVTGFQEREETHKTSIRISPIPAIK